MDTQSTRPIVAIIGRPNVGKSTLFNAMVGERRSIISDIPGTTRDSMLQLMKPDSGMHYWLVDTAGLSNAQGQTLEGAIQKQVDTALERANIILLMVDAKLPLTTDDYDVAHKLRRTKKPVILVGNKIDDGQEYRALEYANLGIGEPFSISARNHWRVWELQDLIEARLTEQGCEPEAPEEDEDREGDTAVRVAFVGRPNVGKSSLTNAILKSERSVICADAGTTRDALDTPFTDPEGREFVLVDTAGLRRPGKRTKESLEYWSTLRSAQAVERSDVCVLVLDGAEGVTHQDLAVAGQIVEAGKGLLLCVNKLDRVRDHVRGTVEEDDTTPAPPVEGKNMEEMRRNYLAYLRYRMPFLPWAPVIFTSAVQGKGLEDILTNTHGIAQERKKRISTAELNRFVPDIFYGHVPPSHGTKIGKMKYATQTDDMPPTFLFFVNNEKAFHFSYRRYIENRLRERYGFFGTPIRIRMKDAMDGHKKRRKSK